MHFRNNMIFLLLDANIWFKKSLKISVFLSWKWPNFLSKSRWIGLSSFHCQLAQQYLDWEGQTRICYINGLKIEVFLMDLGWIVPQWLRSIVSLGACTFGIFWYNNALQFLSITLLMSLLKRIWFEGAF